MPIERCTLDGGEMGWRWGASGTCYADRAQAEAQAVAAYASGYRERAVKAVTRLDVQGDAGECRVGVQTADMVELFLSGAVLQGRFLLERLKADEKQTEWRLFRPADQRPFVETNEVIQVVSDLAKTGHAYIIWAHPDSADAQVIDVPTEAKKIGKVEVQYFVPIAKIDEERRLVYGIVLEPDTIDSQNDTIAAEDIEVAAHRYLERARVVGLQHRQKVKAVPVESYIAPVDFTLGDEQVRKGSWVMVTRIDDMAAWQDVKDGKLTGYSIGGFGMRQETPT